MVGTAESKMLCHSTKSKVVRLEPTYLWFSQGSDHFCDTRQVYNLIHWLNTLAKFTENINQIYMVFLLKSYNSKILNKI